ncbi:glyoxalase superfamily protein [Mucilaginibacter pedocola]|uniref:Bleomycin resistance protein n=1 Tax=Mucilaginibacter pedocola TaxID=1792845 RepID=A0A1S9PDF7_9SPHI|nr:glyoxalase superfamily protein [Mucilaginibacter pedocola]OOQ58608.1 bleomycin resistance protein [Mucilaginibacter pedocola]
MAIARPIFRIFDYDKAIEFYVDWLGFNIDWEHKPEGSPIYMQVSLQGIVLHLTEHYGDCTPGGRIHIEDFKGLRDYHKLLHSKNYKYYNPGLEKAGWNPDVLTMEVGDPFGNRLTFNSTEN